MDNSYRRAVIKERRAKNHLHCRQLFCLERVVASLDSNMTMAATMTVTAVAVAIAIAILRCL